MKSIDKCPNCGATVEYNEDKTVARCPYCSSSFQMEEKSGPRQTATIKDLQIDERERQDTKGSKINVGIFIFLFFINPVLPIIYAIIKTLKKKD